MYCPKCGKKIKDEGEFCPFCGVSIKEPKKEEAPVSGAKKKKNGGCLIAAVVFLILVVVPPFITFVSGETGIAYGFIGALVVLALLAVVVVVAKKMIKIGTKKPIVVLVVLAVLVVVLVPSYFIIRSYKYDVIAERISFIQDKETELVAAKLLGDTLIKEGAIPVEGVTLQDVNGAATAEKERMAATSYPPELDEYFASVQVWADKIEGAKDGSSWLAIPDSPDKFDILISDSRVEGLFKESVKELAAIKDAGDFVIKKQDRVSLRFIVARLTVMDHFLNSIETYQALSSGEIIKPAYALTKSGAVMKTRRLCFLNGTATTCLPEVRESVRAAKDVAYKLYTFTPPTRYTQPDNEPSITNWDDAFGNIADDLTNISGVGITQGEPVAEPQLPLRAQEFYNQCRNKGGTPEPTSLVKERLPTMETGYNCKIGGCWEFMTVTGKMYAGGNPGCPEQGLVPRRSAWDDFLDGLNGKKDDSNTGKNEKASYDGTYNIKYTYGNCSGIPGFNIGDIGAVTDQVTVKNSRVIWAGGNVPVDQSGNAQWKMNVNYSGVVGYINQTFGFSGSGVSGTFNFQMSTQGLNVGCSGNFTGSKIR